MKNIYYVALLALGLWLTSATTAQAHAVRAENLVQDKTVVVAFTYATGDIPAYVQVEVFGPGNDEVEFQNGRTDALGRFAFFPDKPGAWAVVMTDGMGHKLRHEVSVATSEASATTTAEHQPLAKASASSTPERALLGVSLLCNIFVGAALWRSRKQNA